MNEQPYKEINVHDVIHHGAIVFSDEETDILLAWDGALKYSVFAGRFDGRYDLIDTFYRDTSNLEASRIITREWFRSHGTFNPGP